MQVRDIEFYDFQAR